MTDTTTAEIEAAESAAREARAHAEALAERVRDGGDVAARELREARELAELAELRAEAAHRQAERAAVERRKRERAQLARDVAAHDAAGDALVAALEAASGALDALVTRANAHNAALADLYARAVALDVPPESSGGVDGLARLNDGGMLSGGRRLRPVDPGPIVAAIVHRLAAAHGLSASGRQLAAAVPDLMGIWGPNDLAATVRGAS